MNFARHAIYTADRTGLLACHDFEAAGTAIFKVVSSPYEDIVQVCQEGLAQILKKQDNRGNFLYFEYAKRFGELIRLLSRVLAAPFKTRSTSFTITGFWGRLRRFECR